MALAKSIALRSTVKGGDVLLYFFKIVLLNFVRLLRRIWGSAEHGTVDMDMWGLTEVGFHLHFY